MGSSYNSCSTTNLKQRDHFSVERRPTLLKDFLVDDSNSCSLSGFTSFPRKPCDPKTLVEIDLRSPKNIANPTNNIASYKLLRSRSKAAASTTISALQAMINAVKNIHFTAIKSPSVLPRSLSRRLSKKKSQNKQSEVKNTVTVKDIIRWRSFRDIVEEKSPPLPSSPHHCTTTTTGSPSTTPRSGSSWCDSDFTSDYLPSWNGNFDECGAKEVESGKTFLPCVGEDSLEAIAETGTYTKVGPKEDEEEQQNSPVSVIDFEYEEDEESSSSFDQSLATVERTREKIMEKIRRFETLAKLDPVDLDNWTSIDENISSGEDDDNDEDVDHELEGIEETNTSYEEEELPEVEEKAWKLLNHVKESGLECCNDNMDLLLDFFRDELTARTYEWKKNGIEVELLNKAKAWINGEDSLWAVGWELEHKKEVHVRDMDREGRWNKFEEEQQQLALEIENGVLGLLVDDLLLDLISS